MGTAKKLAGAVIGAIAALGAMRLVQRALEKRPLVSRAHDARDRLRELRDDAREIAQNAGAECKGKLAELVQKLSALIKERGDR